MAQGISYGLPFSLFQKRYAYPSYYLYRIDSQKKIHIFNTLSLTFHKDITIVFTPAFLNDCCKPYNPSAVARPFPDSQADKTVKAVLLKSSREILALLLPALPQKDSGLAKVKAII